jgi:hypothetical protein
MLVQLTNAGAALIEANQGPIEIASYELGTAYNYVPEGTDTNIHGTVVLEGAPSSYVALSANVVKYSVYLDFQSGPYTFGELGLFTGTGVLFALAANTVPLTKPLNASMRLDIYLSMVGTNYAMWLDFAESNNQFQMAILQSVDQLPQPQNAVPNAYIITPAGGGQSAFLAYTDQSGLWNFDAYAYANQGSASIVGYSSQSVTISQSQFVTGMDPDYVGQVVCQFSTGALYGICRYITTAVQSGGNVTLTFDNPLMITPAVGDQIVVFGRQALSTTIPNLPIATTTTLGGVIVGDTLTVSSTGLINVNATSYPVLSVNGMTGDVVITASNISGLATVAISGSYTDLKNTPTPYTLPIATTSTLGGIIGPSNGHLTIASNGVIDIGFTPVLTVNEIAPDGTGNVNVTSPAVVGLVSPTQIVNGTDFNTLQTCGLFFGADADASSFLNAPTTATGGTLDIEPFTTTATGGDVIQRYTTNAGLYFRRFSQSANTWTPWIVVATAGNAVPIATTTTLGGIIVGAGLSITSGGTLSTNIQTVNGLSTANISITAASVGAIATSQAGAQGGVAVLNINPTQPSTTPATDPFTYGRIPFYENTLGTWWTAGTWDANANHVIQAQTGNTVTDTNTSLLSSGEQIIDISYNNNGGPGTAPTPNYQTVSAEGFAYEVTVAGTTTIDGVTDWQVGDVAICRNGTWKKILADAATTGGPFVRQAGAWTALPTATTSTQGVIEVGTGLQVTFGSVSVAGVAANSLSNAASGTISYRTNADGTIEFFGQTALASGTNSVEVALPIAVPNGFVGWAASDTGSDCFAFGISVVDTQHITIYAPVYWINSSGTVALRDSAIASWHLVGH